MKIEGFNIYLITNFCLPWCWSIIILIALDVIINIIIIILGRRYVSTQLNKLFNGNEKYVQAQE